MSLVHPESIAVIGEGLGLKLGHEVASAVASDVEYRVREVLEQAVKFKESSKRERLTTEDLNQALRLRNVEPLYGYGGSDPLKFERAAGTRDLFFLADKELDLERVIGTPLPTVPREVTMSAHWLAVEGVQPAIPQNPDSATVDQLEAAAKKRRTATRASGSTVTDPAVGRGDGGSNNAATAAVDNGDDAAAAVRVRLPVKQVIADELKEYFVRVTGALEAALAQADDELLTQVLAAVRSDAGIQRLVPYFAQYIEESIVERMSDLGTLRGCLRLAEALLRNQHLSVELYLHQMMPGLVTCLVGARLGSSDVDSDDHWSLRDEAAGLLSFVERQFGKSYVELLPRLVRTLLQGLLGDSSLATKYGALRGLSALGPQAVRTAVLPNCMQLASLFRDPSAPKAQGTRCFDCLTHVVGTYVRDSEADDVSAEIQDLFGPALDPYINARQSKKK